MQNIIAACPRRCALSSCFLPLFFFFPLFFSLPLSHRIEYFYACFYVRRRKWILFIFGLPHSFFQSSLRRKIPMEKMIRTLAKMAMRQRPSMYVVIHIKSKVIASRQPGNGAFLFFPWLLSPSSALKEDSRREWRGEKERGPNVPTSPRFLLPLFPLDEKMKENSGVS